MQIVHTFWFVSIWRSSQIPHFFFLIFFPFCQGIFQYPHFVSDADRDLSESHVCFSFGELSESEFVSDAEIFQNPQFVSDVEIFQKLHLVSGPEICDNSFDDRLVFVGLFVTLQVRSLCPELSANQENSGHKDIISGQRRSTVQVVSRTKERGRPSECENKERELTKEKADSWF